METYDQAFVLNRQVSRSSMVPGSEPLDLEYIYSECPLPVVLIHLMCAIYLRSYLFSLHCYHLVLSSGLLCPDAPFD